MGEPAITVNKPYFWKDHVKICKLIYSIEVEYKSLDNLMHMTIHRQNKNEVETHNHSLMEQSNLKLQLSFISSGFCCDASHMFSYPFC